MQEETSKRKRQRTNYVPKILFVKRRKGRKTRQPESTQETMKKKYPSRENPVGKQHDFFKIYEEEMAQVLGNLGMSLTDDIDGPEEPQDPTSPPSKLYL
jgi:hypothetical protein